MDFRCKEEPCAHFGIKAGVGVALADPKVAYLDPPVWCWSDHEYVLLGAVVSTMLIVLPYRLFLLRV